MIVQDEKVFVILILECEYRVTYALIMIIKQIILFSLSLAAALL